jgi:hypothetical protein
VKGIEEGCPSLPARQAHLQHVDSGAAIHRKDLPGDILLFLVSTRPYPLCE